MQLAAAEVHRGFIGSEGVKKDRFVRVDELRARCHERHPSLKVIPHPVKTERTRNASQT